MENSGRSSRAAEQDCGLEDSRSQMNITLDDIRKKFDALQSGLESREEVADFALRAMKADDAQSLKMDAASSDKIWEAILYLSGVDLKDTPDSYLHSVANFIAERHRLGI